MTWILRFKLVDPPFCFQDLITELSEKDPTFKVVKFTKDECVIENDSKQQAFRRGMWIKERLAIMCEDLGLPEEARKAENLFFQVFYRKTHIIKLEKTEGLEWQLSNGE